MVASCIEGDWLIFFDRFKISAAIELVSWFPSGAVLNRFTDLSAVCLCTSVEFK